MLLPILYVGQIHALYLAYTTQYQLLNVQVPFFFKNVIDSLNITFTEETTLLAICGAAVIGCK